MLNRLALLFVTLFWLTMTYLLWRSEYVGQERLASNVPAVMVWKKILTSPDTSSLDIIHQGVKVGYCRWAASEGVEPARRGSLTDDTPPGMTRGAVTSYRLDLEGNLALAEMGGRLRFDCSLRISTTNSWQDFHLRLNLKPSSWEVNAHANDQTVHFLMDDRDGKFERVLKFSELQNPQTLIDEFNLPPALGMLGAFGSLEGGKPGKPASLGLDWKARNEWVAIGHTSVRAYLLEATVFDRYRMRIMVSRVGEILKVELPDEWELENEQLGALQQ